MLGSGHLLVSPPPSRGRRKKAACRIRATEAAECRRIEQGGVALSDPGHLVGGGDGSRAVEAPLLPPSLAGCRVAPVRGEERREGGGGEDKDEDGIFLKC